jgi:hypothetical protein
MKPPKPNAEQVKHPKRLLMADLVTHLMFYALDKNCTVVLMDDMNTDVYSRPGADTEGLKL